MPIAGQLDLDHFVEITKQYAQGIAPGTSLDSSTKKAVPVETDGGQKVGWNTRCPKHSNDGYSMVEVTMSI